MANKVPTPRPNPFSRLAKHNQQDLKRQRASAGRTAGTLKGRKKAGRRKFKKRPLDRFDTQGSRSKTSVQRGRMSLEKVIKKEKEDQKQRDLINSMPWVDQHGVNKGPVSKRHPRGKGI